MTGVRKWRFHLESLHRIKLKFIAIALITLSSILLINSGKAPAQSAPRFSDVQGHWAQACIEDLAARGVVNGYPNGSFRPDGSVTRAEFATLLDAAFELNPIRSGIRFQDVPSRHWANGAIQSAYRADFLSGYPNQRFQPNQAIPKAQVLVAIASGLQVNSAVLSENELDKWFDDAADIPAYAKPGVTAALENRLVVNYPNPKRLHPNRSATRAEVASALCQAYDAASGTAANGTAASGLIPGQYIATAAAVAAPPVTPEEADGLDGGLGAAQPEEEIRGVWLTNIDSEVLFSTESVKSAIAELAELNFNTLYPTVWNWGFTLYPSDVAERVFGERIDPEPGLKDRDMLQEVIEEGHRHDMKVMPWFEFGFMAPSYSKLAREHPDWLTQRQDGTRVYWQGEHPRVWLNPFHPEVQEFIISLATEIVANYDLDGIQFDDHFGLPYEFGYDPYTVNLYRQDHNGQSPPSNPKDPEWLRWRADRISTDFARMFRAIKNTKEDCIVALSPNPQPFAYENFLQDWTTWQQQGFLEEMILQVYRPDMDRFIMELTRPTVQSARRHIPVGIGILTGLKNSPVPISLIQQQAITARRYNYRGISFFFYETLWTGNESREERKAMLRSLFATPAKHPNLNEGWTMPLQ